MDATLAQSDLIKGTGQEEVDTSYFNITVAVVKKTQQTGQYVTAALTSF